MTILMNGTCAILPQQKYSAISGRIQQSRYVSVYIGLSQDALALGQGILLRHLGHQGCFKSPGNTSRIMGNVQAITAQPGILKDAQPDPQQNSAGSPLDQEHGDASQAHQMPDANKDLQSLQQHAPDQENDPIQVGLVLLQA